MIMGWVTYASSPERAITTEDLLHVHVVVSSPRYTCNYVSLITSTRGCQFMRQCSKRVWKHLQAAAFSPGSV